MATLQEVLVICDSDNSLWTSCMWDPDTGTSLMTYKGGGTAESKTLSFIGKDYIAAVERTKPVLHVWPLNSQQTVQGMRFILPGKAGALAVTPDGSYIVAGIDEKIYLWQTSSGSLLTIINRHYQKVVQLKFTPDGKFFVSAAEDGMVMVWSLTTVAAHPEVELVTQTTAGQHDPVYLFSDHTLPITDICISKFGIIGRLVTVSSDRTCKIYDFASGEILLNLIFEEPLSSVVLDVLELNVFIGSSEGNIYQFSLTNPPRNRDVSVSSENPKFTAHVKAVTCLSVALNGQILMSGSNDKQVILWHIPSKQPVRTLKLKGPITNAFFTVNLPAIYKQDFSPSIVLHSLDRTVEKDSEDVLEIEVLIKKKINFWPQPQGDMFDSSLSTTELENAFKSKELALKEELEKLKTINANLYAFSIDKTLSAVSDINLSKLNKNKKKKKNKN